MKTIDDKKLNEFLEPMAESEITPEHRAWMDDQIRKTLAKKQAGTVTYRSLDAVMRKFGFNAR